MGIDVHSQLDSILGNVARQHKFAVDITPPTNLLTSFSASSINTFVTSTSIPQITIHTADFYQYGRKVKIPSRMEYSQSWNCSFYLDDTHYIRRLLEVWMMTGLDAYYSSTNGEVEPNNGTSVVNSFLGGIMDGIKQGFNSQSSVKSGLGEVKITPMTVDGRNIYNYTLYNVYPTSVGQIDYSNEPGQLSTFTAEFAFTHYSVSTSNPISDVITNTVKSLF